MDAKWLAVGLIVGLVIGIAAGYFAHTPSPAPTTATTITATATATTTSTVTTTATVTASAPATAPFAIGAAGTLKFSFTDLLNIYSNLYPYIKAAPPYFKGSGAVAQEEVNTKQFSLVAAADTTTIPSVLFKSGLADYEIAFGATQMAIIVNLNTTAGQEVYRLWLQAQNETPLTAQWNATWTQIFSIIALSPNVVVGVSNPFTDPSGYQAICMLRLAGLTFFNNMSYLVDAIYNNTNKYVMRNTETDLLPVMASGQIQFILSAYVSNAVVQVKQYANVTYITLPPQVSLGSLKYADYYHQANFNWTEVGVTKYFVCNPVVYTFTIPNTAPNPQGAVYYALLLFSPQGQKILRDNGIMPITPGIVFGNYSDVPALLRPYVIPVSQVPQYAAIFPSS
ncbi:MAG: substrate-binding domain-containing protein [Thermoproteus sp. AZ2]|uniref:Substrate-binding domain-containing protein n=1 Tax=Thermoproteus sp. AZ2 TaxID=1609232 RepID=A0ACC6V0K6_9CREN|nr:MAG: molybdenum ABC transporter substrate-binding protein [Thermoproteus sp. AZ2]